jgi:hypothetical protein
MATGDGARARRAVAIAGCYSDLNLDTDAGMVTGNGGFNITKTATGWKATFVELMQDGGEYYPEAAIDNLRVDERRGVVTFNIDLHDGAHVTRLRNVTATVTRTGIKMNWRGHSASHGKPDPFMRRLAHC